MMTLTAAPSAETGRPLVAFISTADHRFQAVWQEIREPMFQLSSRLIEDGSNR